MDSESGDDETDELSNSVEKSEKKNDQDQVDGMRQEVYSKGIPKFIPMPIDDA